MDLPSFYEATVIPFSKQITSKVHIPTCAPVTQEADKGGLLVPI